MSLVPPQRLDFSKDPAAVELAESMRQDVEALVQDWWPPELTAQAYAALDRCDFRYLDHVLGRIEELHHLSHGRVSEQAPS